MTTPPDDRSFRREMATAYRSGWHFIDLVTAVPHTGDSLMVTVFGEPVVVTRDEDDDVRAFRCLRRPRGAPQPVRCAIRYGILWNRRVATGAGSSGAAQCGRASPVRAGCAVEHTRPRGPGSARRAPAGMAATAADAATAAVVANPAEIAVTVRLRP